MSEREGVCEIDRQRELERKRGSMREKERERDSKEFSKFERANSPIKIFLPSQ